VVQVLQLLLVSLDKAAAIQPEVLVKMVAEAVAQLRLLAQMR
jgi:hypothetical protein